MAYNTLYTGPKPSENGLYCTPMLKIDGDQSVSGRDPEAARAALSPLQGKADSTVMFSFQLEPGWKTDHLDMVAFVRDKETGIVHHAEVVSWGGDRPAPGASARTTSGLRSRDRNTH